MRRLLAGSIKGALVLALSTTALITPASAQTQRSGSGLQITPTRHEVSVEPGTKKDVTIGLKNVSGVDIVARAVVHDFEADNATGQPKIKTDPKIETPRSVKKFLKGVGDVSLAKDEVKNLTLSLAVPSSAAPGAYYGIIRYQAVPKDRGEAEKGNVSLTASVGTIVLLEVPGETTESMEAVGIRPLRDRRTGMIFLKPPNKLAVELKNTGNTFIKPFGKVVVTKKGGKEVYSYELNNTDPRGNVLPGSGRTFTDDIKNIGDFGNYTATANVGYGKGGQVVTIRTSFWVVHPILLLVIAGLLIALAVFGFLFYRRNFAYRKAKR